MKVTNLMTATVALALATSLFIGCSSSSSNDDDDSETTYLSEGVIVDPYIVGAVICEDKNIDGVCNSGEQLSTASDENGLFKFENALSAGSHVIVETHGKHEGVTYDLDLAAIVDSSGRADVISPLTTLLVRGLTTAQVAEILNNVATIEGIKLSDGTTQWSIDSSAISDDPLANSLVDTKVGSLDEADLVGIQASLATYGLLKIMKGSTRLNELSTTELYSSAMGNDGHTEVLNIAKALLSNITATLNKTLLTQIKSGIDTGRSTMATAIATNHPSYNTASASDLADEAMPEPTIELVIKVAVSIVDRLSTVGYSTCNSTSGTDTQKVTAALAEVANEATNVSSQAVSLGTKLYGMMYQENLAKLNVSSYDFRQHLPSDIKSGIDAYNDGKTTFRFDASSTIKAY